MIPVAPPQGQNGRGSGPSPPGWALGWVKALQKLLLVDFAHLVARDLLHHDQLRGDGVGSHGVPATPKCSSYSWAGRAEPSPEHPQPQPAPPGTPIHSPGAHLSSAPGSQPLWSCVVGCLLLACPCGEQLIAGDSSAGSVTLLEGRDSTKWCEEYRTPVFPVPVPEGTAGEPPPRSVSVSVTWQRSQPRAPSRALCGARRGGSPAFCCPCVTKLGPCPAPAAPWH